MSGPEQVECTFDPVVLRRAADLPVVWARPTDGCHGYPAQDPGVRFVCQAKRCRTSFFLDWIMICGRGVRTDTARHPVAM